MVCCCAKCLSMTGGSPSTRTCGQWALNSIIFWSIRLIKCWVDLKRKEDRIFNQVCIKAAAILLHIYECHSSKYCTFHELNWKEHASVVPEWALPFLVLSRHKWTWTWTWTQVNRSDIVHQGRESHSVSTACPGATSAYTFRVSATGPDLLEGHYPVNKKRYFNVLKRFYKVGARTSV